MKSLLTIALAVALCGAVAQAQMVMYEDFESYPVDETIHGKGVDQTDLNPGVDIPRWYCQDNTSLLFWGDGTQRDHGQSVVREQPDGNQYLEMGTVGPGDGVYDTLGTAMSMESMQIAGQGTIYMRWCVNDISSNMLCTNDLEAGWDYAGMAPPPDTGAIGADGWQEGYIQRRGLHEDGRSVHAGRRHRRPSP